MGDDDTKLGNVSPEAADGGAMREPAIAYLQSVLNSAGELVQTLAGAAPSPPTFAEGPVPYARFAGSPLHDDAVHYRFSTYRAMIGPPSPYGPWRAAVIDGVEVLVAPRIVADRTVAESAPVLIARLPADLQLGLASRRPLSECRDPEHAARIFAVGAGAPGVFEPLSALALNVDLVVRDSCLVAVSPSLDPAVVDRLAVALAGCARAIAARQSQVGPSPEQERRARTLDAALLPLDPTVDAASGRAAAEVRGGHVEVQYDLDGHDPRTYASVALREPLPFEISVTRSGGWLPQVLAHDIAVGDGPFDRAFEVRGPDPSAVRAWLTPPVREALRALHRSCDVVALDRRGLRVSAKGLLDDAALRALVDHMLIAALPAEGQPGASPYR